MVNGKKKEKEMTIDKTRNVSYECKKMWINDFDNDTVNLDLRESEEGWWLKDEDWRIMG